MANEIQQFFRDHGISEVEAIIPDMAGIARGKIMPAEKFAEDEGMRLPESIFLQTVTGDYPPDTGDAMSPAEIDIVLKADPKTVRRVPWAAEPTAQVIHDCFYSDGRRVTMAPRHVLRNVLELYAQRGWEPVIAPELEFYLVEPNMDADYPLKPPGRPLGPRGAGPPVLQHRGGERVRPAVRRHVPVLRGPGHRDRYPDPRGRAGADGDQPDPRLSAGSRRPGLPVQAHRPRGGAPPQDVLPRSWPSPMPRSRAAPCTSTRAWWTRKTRKNIFSNPDGTPSQLFFSHIAGLQKYLPAAMALFCPNVNSYRRAHALPVRAHQRALGLRQPHRGPARAHVQRRGAPGREPRRRGGCQPLHRHRGLAGLRLPRHDRGPAAERSRHRQRPRPALRPAALAG